MKSHFKPIPVEPLTTHVGDEVLEISPYMAGGRLCSPASGNASTHMASAPALLGCPAGRFRSSP